MRKKRKRRAASALAPLRFSDKFAAQFAAASIAMLLRNVTPGFRVAVGLPPRPSQAPRPRPMINVTPRPGSK